MSVSCGGDLRGALAVLILGAAACSVSACELIAGTEDLIFAGDAGGEASPTPSAPDGSSNPVDAIGGNVAEGGGDDDSAIHDGGARPDRELGNDADPTICTIPQGGLPSDPTQLECADQTCSTGQVCCGAPAGSIPLTCRPEAQFCPNMSVNGHRVDIMVTCNESRGCGEGSVCCFDGRQTICSGACAPNTQWQLCRCNEDCGGNLCVPQNCTALGLGHITACSIITGCN